jgi:hypothetical protein
MKLKENLVLKQVAGNWVVLPLATANVNFNGMLKLNESGAMLWNLLLQGKNRDELADMLTKVYDIDLSTALADVDEFLNRLKTAGCLDME